MLMTHKLNTVQELILSIYYLTPLFTNPLKMLFNTNSLYNKKLIKENKQHDYFNQNAWCQKMLNIPGTVNSSTELKTINLKVRPIRSF